MYSEREAWQDVRKTALNAPHSQEMQRILTWATVMLKQLKGGVHVNPRAVKKRTKIGAHVQAIAYVHAKDGGEYVHGFGDAELSEADLKRGILNLKELKHTTHVEMFSNPDGTVTLIGTKGQPLAALFD